jgi:hypothetical protein
VVESITLDRPVIRISQSIVDRSVNIAALDAFNADSRQAPGPASRPQGTRGPSPQDLIPQITLNSGVIQIGEHDARSFRSLKQFDLEGRVISATDAQGGLQVSLREVPTPGQSPSHKPLEVTGRVAADTLTLRASGLELGDLSAESVPQPLRERFRSLELVGTIGVTTLTYHLRTGGLEARTALENVALNLPITPKPGIDINDRVIPVPQELRDRLLRMEDVRGELVLRTFPTTSPSRWTARATRLPSRRGWCAATSSSRSSPPSCSSPRASCGGGSSSSRTPPASSTPPSTSRAALRRRARPPT